MLGTLFLSALSGHWHQAHIAALRADGVSAGMLGMDNVVSEDTVRPALRAMEEVAGTNGLQTHLDASVLPLLGAPWILDTDVTVKPLYGKQEGAVVGYHPQQPGRPYLPHRPDRRAAVDAQRDRGAGQREPCQHHLARVNRIDRGFTPRQTSGAGARG